MLVNQLKQATLFQNIPNQHMLFFSTGILFLARDNVQHKLLHGYQVLYYTEGGYFSITPGWMYVMSLIIMTQNINFKDFISLFVTDTIFL